MLEQRGKRTARYEPWAMERGQTRLKGPCVILFIDQEGCWKVALRDSDSQLCFADKLKLRSLPRCRRTSRDCAEMVMLRAWHGASGGCDIAGHPSRAGRQSSNTCAMSANLPRVRRDPAELDEAQPRASAPSQGRPMRGTSRSVKGRDRTLSLDISAAVYRYPKSWHTA